MKVLISGSHGLVGTALANSLKGEGHEVFALVRHAPHSDAQVEWYPDRGSLALSRLEGMDAVVHLAGESIAAGRWSEEKKKRIRDSRIKATIGYYGDRGDLIVTEGTAPGNDFLSSVCVEWEQATRSAAAKDIRVVNTRFGIILSVDGGALKKMLPPFRMGVGGRIGSGQQWMSWIALDDVVDAIKFALSNESLGGPVNYVAPNPVTNAEFTKTLGTVLSRPTLFPVPAFAVRLLFGEMGEALLLSGARVKPAQLENAGYKFKYSTLEAALRAALVMK